MNRTEYSIKAAKLTTDSFAAFWRKEDLYLELSGVCVAFHTKHTTTVCGRNVEFLNVKPGGTYIDHWALN